MIINHKIKICLIFVLLLFVDCNNDNKLNAYVFRIVDSYPKMLNNSHPAYLRYIQIMFAIKNTLQDSIFVPFNIQNGCSEYCSYIQVKGKNGRTNNNISQVYHLGNHDIKIAPNEINYFTLTLYINDLRELGFVGYENPKYILTHLNFYYRYNKKDISNLYTPHVFFVKNNLDNIKSPMKVLKISKLNWNAMIDKKTNIVYCYANLNHKWINALQDQF